MSDQNNDKPCIEHRGHGFTVRVNLTEFALDVVQDWDTAFDVCEQMLTHAVPYQWNEEQHPSYYAEFDVDDEEELRRQLDQAKKS